jgi:hypothetical protein
MLLPAPSSSLKVNQILRLELYTEDPEIMQPASEEEMDETKATELDQRSFTAPETVAKVRIPRALSDIDGLEVT